jgi:hypothetical protein
MLTSVLPGWGWLSPMGHVKRAAEAFDELLLG